MDVWVSLDVYLVTRTGILEPMTAYATGFSSVQKLLIVFGVLLTAVAVWYFLQSRADTTIGQTLTSNTSLETGLVGHWTFDGQDVDWGSTTAEIKDRSGNGYHGNATGGISTHSVTDGVLGQAAQFNGVQVDRIGHGNVLNNDTNDFTISSWVYAAPPMVDSDYGVIVATKPVTAGASDGYQLSIFDNGSVDFRIGDGVNAAGCTLHSGFPIQEWHHLLVTVSRTNDEAVAFVDGVQSGSCDISALGGNGIASTYSFIIGAHDNVQARQFSGALDDVRIYNRALSAEEVKRLYGLGATTKVAQTITSNPSLETGLVGHWTFDGATMSPTFDSTTEVAATDPLRGGLLLHWPMGGTYLDWGATSAEIRDASGNGNHGDANSNYSSNVTTGVFGEGIDFSERRIVGPTDIISTAVTYAFWANFDIDTPSNPQMIAHYEYSSGNGFCGDTDLGIGYSATRNVTMWADAGGTCSSASAQVAQVGKWYYVTGTWSSGGPARLYIDGELRSTSGTTLTNDFGWKTLHFGRASDATRYLNAQIDDFRVYNRELSPAEVALLYELPRTRMFQDRSSAGNDAVEVFTEADAGAMGQARAFNGTTSLVAVRDVIPPSDDFSVALWFQTENSPTSVDESLFATIAETGTNDALLIMEIERDGNVCSAGELRFGIRDTNSGSGDNVCSSVAMQDSAWHSLVMTYDIDGDVVMYVDGVQSQSTAVTANSNGTKDFSEYPPYVGAQNFRGTPNESLNGSVDDVRIYDRALSADEVKRLYELGATTKVAQALTTNPALEDGLVGHWTFDGPDVDWGSTTAEIKDRSDQGNHGDAQGGMTPQSATDGALGQALYVERDGEKVAVPEDGEFDVASGTDFSVAAWIRTSGTTSWQTIIDARGGSDAPDNGYLLGVRSDGIKFLIVDDEGLRHEDSVAPTTYNVQEGRWHHIVALYSDADTCMRTYADGQEQALECNYNYGSITQNHTTNQIMIGGEIGTGAWDSFLGSLDDVRIYNRALSAEEVKRLYELGQ